MTVLHALVFCWPGQVDNSIAIAGALRGHVDRLTVIDASDTRCPDDLAAGGDVQWLNVDTKWYYGGKFAKALEVFDGDVMLQIQGDARSDDWPALVRHCRTAFVALPSLGIWSPDVDFTLFPTDQVALYQIGSSARFVVAQSDCIVWALARPLVERLRRLDYTNNNFGWGIDWAAISHCFANKLLVVRDKVCHVDHPPSRNYDTAAARGQMQAFVDQFTPDEFTQYTLLQGYLNATNQGVKGQAMLLAHAARRAIAKRIG